MPTQWDSSGTNTARGHMRLADGTIDNTEGFGAFDDIGFEHSRKARNIDVGGGKYDDSTVYLKTRYDIDSYVYDPFGRSPEHNRRILQMATERPFDSATSISVLNVINQPSIRSEHIKLIYDALKLGGFAYFKVYAGNCSGRESFADQSYQSNQDASYYVHEVARQFGPQNTQLVLTKNLIVAQKMPIRS